MPLLPEAPELSSGRREAAPADPVLCGLTLLLEHLVGLCDLHFLRQADRPAVQELQDLVLHLL